MSLFGGKRGTMKALHRRKAECERMKIILSRRNKTGLFVRSMAIFFWANTIAVSTYTIASGPLRLSRLRISVARVQHSHQDGQRDKPITASVYRSRPVPQITHQTFLYSSSAYLASSDLDKRSTTKDKTLNDEDEAASQLLLVPSYRKLLVFASTTFMIWLSEPLLSLVDTTVVGLTVPNAVTQIASLGPATTFADSLLYSTYFLSIATTNLIAAALAVKDYRKLQQITSHVLAVAAILGAACTLFSFFLAPTLIAQMAGISGTPELVDFAVRYTWIRSSVAMASVIGITMQSFCLATQDIKTPALAVVAASITNVCGDLLLRKMGVIGAAMATAAASVVSAAILFWAVRNQLLQWRELEHQQQRLRLQTDTASDHLFRNASFATITNDDGIYHTVVHDVIEISDKASKPGCKSRPDSFRVITQTIKSEEDGIINKPLVIFALPDRKSALQLVTLAGPIFFAIIAKVACYGAMTVRCTDFGVEALAAHSIMMRIFFFFACFGDSLSQTAQSFLPATLYPKPSRKAFVKIFRRLVTLAAGIGVVNSQASRLILKYLGQYLTKDVAIINLMKYHTGFMGLSILLHPFIMLMEGIVIASRDFRTLIFTYGATLGLHFSILNFFSGSFPAVWRTFFVFQTTRLGFYSWNVWNRQANIRNTEIVATDAE